MFFVFFVFFGVFFVIVWFINDGLWGSMLLWFIVFVVCMMIFFFLCYCGVGFVGVFVFVVMLLVVERVCFELLIFYLSE